MSEAIADYFLNFKDSKKKIETLPSVSPQLVPMFSPEEIQRLTIKIKRQ